ncbi:MAG: pentapeptide repeat-containing protein [Christensenellaceae bacterium]|jgi:uncharacterized protein YjbI with pentapeptide repeats|nr:pentapeptide repeat-containing protein [Christensenellaceae bacterium]
MSIQNLTVQSSKNANFTNAIFKGCNLDNNEFLGAKLQNIEFTKSSLKNLTIGGEITNCQFTNGCTFKKVIFKNATLKNLFIKNVSNMKSILFENCKADKLSYEFLRLAKANVNNIEVFS